MVRKGGLEPPCLLGATPSRWCVCQFHHFRARPDRQKTAFQAKRRGFLSIAKTRLNEAVSDPREWFLSRLPVLTTCRDCPCDEGPGSPLKAHFQELVCLTRSVTLADGPGLRHAAVRAFSVQSSCPWTTTSRTPDQSPATCSLVISARTPSGSRSAASSVTRANRSSERAMSPVQPVW